MYNHYGSAINLNVAPSFNVFSEFDYVYHMVVFLVQINEI